MLSLRKAIDELIYPFRDAAILLALIVFWMLFTIAIYAGLFGLWLLVVIVPAFFQYLLVVLQARSDGREAPAVDVELFSWVQKPWSLFPMVLVSLAGVGVFVLARGGHDALAILVAALAFVLLPLALSVLTITHSALECLRPSRLWRVARGWGRYYALVLAVSLIGILLVYLGIKFDLPGPLLIVSILYCFLLMASVGGHAIAIQDVPIEVSISDPVMPSGQEVREGENQRRTRILNHAYGMISRGNRSGGVSHILDDIQDSADKTESFRWYFTQMLRWDSPAAAALVGQQFISLLLATRQDHEAITTIVRCRHADSAFALQEGDKVAAPRLTRLIHDPELKAWLAGGE